MKKKIVVILISLFTIFIFSGCDTTDYYHGQPLENFNDCVSEYGTACRLAPLIEIIPTSGARYRDIKLIHDFEYVDGLWFWSSNDIGLSTAMDRCLMYIEFTEDIYQSAKLSIFNCEDPNVKVDYQTEYVYEGYTFYKSYFHDNYEELVGGLYTCAMAGYNDEKRTLVFISMACIIKHYPELDTDLEDFGFYLKTFYGDFYDFDA